MLTTITIEQAHEITEWSKQYLRHLCDKGVIGRKWSQKEAPSRYAYVVSVPLLANEMGMTATEIEKILEERKR